MAESVPGKNVANSRRKRLSEARKKGQVARSRELNTLLVMLTSALALWLMSGTTMSGMTQLIEEALSPTGDILRERELVAQQFAYVASSALLLISPFLAITVVLRSRSCTDGRAVV